MNPEHLEPVDCRTNVLRGEGHAARNAVATHCKHGHPLTPENVYVRGARRQCKPCIFARTRAHEPS